MPVIKSSSNEKIWLRRDRNRQLLIWFAWLVGVAVFMYCWQQISDKTNWGFVADAPSIASDIWNRATPPRWSYIEKLWKPLWDTLNIATLGTLLAILFAVPIAFLAARNTTPSVIFFRPIALLIIVGSRSINSIIWAVLFVTIIGPGILAGLLAIGLRSIGFPGQVAV